MDMVKILEDQKAAVEKEIGTLNGQIAQLQHGLQQANLRAVQLQGAHERINILIEEVQKYAAQDTSGTDRAMETSEVRDDQDVAGNV